MVTEHAMKADFSATPMGAFAARLVHQLGIDEAACVCRDNHWDGILALIERRHATAPAQRAA